jgi:hypothetical protein
MLSKPSFCYALLILSSHLATAQVTSTFNTNDEGWTVVQNGSNPVNYSATGGNPGGFVSTVDVVGAAAPLLIWWYWQAPPKFTGDVSSVYGRFLRFDLRSSGTGSDFSQPDVIISDGITTLYYFFPTDVQLPYPTAYQSYQAGFFENQWRTTASRTATRPTQAQLLAVLASLTTLRIRGEYDAAEAPSNTGMLDNVMLETLPALPTPTVPGGVNICNGATGTITVTATGDTNLQYQWQADPDGAGELNGYSDLSDDAIHTGTNTATLTINAEASLHTDRYRCIVRGSTTAATPSNATTLSVLTSPPAPEAVSTPACGPSPVTLVAAGAKDGQYRWYDVATGGTPIASATNSTFVTPPLTTATNLLRYGSQRHVREWQNTCERRYQRPLQSAPAHHHTNRSNPDRR